MFGTDGLYSGESCNVLNRSPFFLDSVRPCGDCQHLEYKKHGLIFAASALGLILRWHQSHVAGCQVETGS